MNNTLSQRPGSSASRCGSAVEWEILGLTADHAPDNVQTTLVLIPKDDLWSSIEHMERQLIRPEVLYNRPDPPVYAPEELAESPLPVSRLRMMIPRQTVLASEDVETWVMAFGKDEFTKLARLWDLPTSFQDPLSTIGTLSMETARDEYGADRGLRVIVGVPRGPQDDPGSVWSLAISWDVSKNLTSALMKGATNSDIEEIRSRIRKSKTLFGHPLLLPTILLEMLLSMVSEQMKPIELAVEYLESRQHRPSNDTPRPRLATDYGASSQADDTFQRYLAREGSILNSKLLSFKERLHFLRDFTNFLQRKAEGIKIDYSRKAPASTYPFDVMCSDLIEMLENMSRSISLRLRLIDYERSRISLMSARTSMSSSVQSTSGSIYIVTFTGMTVVFLPLSFLSSFYGMNATHYRHVPVIYETNLLVQLSIFTLVVLLLFGIFYWRRKKASTRFRIPRSPTPS